MLTRKQELRQAESILRDQLVEIFSFDDPEYGDPADWPDWTDEDRWETVPDPEDELDAIVIGVELPGPTDADWDEYARRSEWQDRLEQIHLVTDEDVITGTGSAG